MPSFADRLKECRKRKNVTQKNVADFLGIKERSYQTYEYGKSEASHAILIKLAEYFEVSVDYLIGYKNYWQDSDGDIKVKVPADIWNLDTDELKKKIDKE